MKSSSAMFQRMLLLVALAASASAAILHPCKAITDILQEALTPKDPYTFPNISDFTYSHGNTSLLFNFNNVQFDGFSNVACEYFSDIDERMALLTLNGSNLNFHTKYSKAEGLLQGQNYSLNSQSSLQVFNYSLALRYHYYSPPWFAPFHGCIISGSLEMTPSAEGIVASILRDNEYILSLNTDTQELLKAATRYLPRFANGLTSILNEILCKYTVPVPTTELPEVSILTKAEVDTEHAGSPYLQEYVEYTEYPEYVEYTEYPGYAEYVEYTT